MSLSTDVFEPTSKSDAKQKAILVEWLNSLLPNVSLPINASDEELREFLIDGIVLCQLLNKLKPGCVTEYGGPVQSPESRSENVKRFLATMDQLCLPRFQLSDLEKGSMKMVIECLLTLRAHFMPNSRAHHHFGAHSGNQLGSDGSTRWKLLGDCFRSGNGVHKGYSYQHALLSPVMAEPSATLPHHGSHKFHDVFQLKHGRYADLPASKISEMMKSNSLDNAPTQSLLSVVNGILDESIERKSGEIPQRVAGLLRKVVQEIERRISTQAEHLKMQNNLFKAREEKYQSRIRVLEALASSASNQEAQAVTCQLHHTKNEPSKIEEKRKTEEQDGKRKVEEQEEKRKVEEQEEKRKLEEQEEKRKFEEQDLVRLTKEKDDFEQNLVRLTKEKDDFQQELARLTKEKDDYEQDVDRLTKEKNDFGHEITALKRELEVLRKMHEERCLQMQTEARGVQKELEDKLKEVMNILSQSRNRVKELEALSESNCQGWSKKEHIYQIFTEFQLGTLRELRFASQSIKQEVVKTQKGYAEEFNVLGSNVRALQNAAQNYYAMLAENQKLHNELQELKGNIRVYCRIRPFFPGQKDKQSTIEYVGENGELIIINPAKQGKESRKSFKFNKVYGQVATQVQVFSDTQPLIQSVLDGYNVCIFAYGQTGSGKTYTMTGPDKASEDEWGVNYRALNHLFQTSQNRENAFSYEISVQMVEIYNEQVRDLLSSDASQKRLGILSGSQPNGLAVPDASMYPVKATSDVLHLMDVGLKNRAKGSTAMNERSSRSHSIVSIHVRGLDRKTGSTLQSSLHLVDLAGSERVDRSEATGDRLKEAQHINKSLSALGDVISALAQKSTHIPYRNSKLTQVLQSSLGGNAKTLMFVQLNPEASSYSETLSTLKFAERASGVELGAAKSSKDGRDVRELMEQVSSLKDTIAKKDEEIERLQSSKNVYTGASNDANSLRYATPQSSMKLSGAEVSGLIEKAASDEENSEEADGSVGRSPIAERAKRFENPDKLKVVVRSPKTPEKSPKESLRVSTGLRKSPSATNLSPKPSSRRWT